MIHYHGTPITPREQLLRLSGRHFCVSYARPDDLAACAPVAQSLMLDNGAFSAKTRGFAFDPLGFYQWVEPLLGHPHWAVVPDVIGGDVEQQKALVKTWPFPAAFGAPVWHLHLPIDYLLDLCSVWPKVCIGSSGKFWKINSPEWRHRMDDVFDALVRVFGQRVPWIHGMRMLSLGGGPYPLASADSTNVARNFKRDTGCAECKAYPIDLRNPPLRWPSFLERTI